MDRRSGNFGELGSFKLAVKREKERSLPSFEGVDVLLEDAESGIKFNMPVTHIKSVLPVHADKPTAKVYSIAGETYFVSGTATEIVGKINEAKIKSTRFKGGHN